MSLPQRTLYSSAPSPPDLPQNDLTFLRVRTRKHEVMVAPDREYLLIVVQNPSGGEGGEAAGGGGK